MQEVLWCPQHEILTQTEPSAVVGSLPGCLTPPWLPYIACRILFATYLPRVASFVTLYNPLCPNIVIDVFPEVVLLTLISAITLYYNLSRLRTMGSCMGGRLLLGALSGSRSSKHYNL